MDFLTDQDSQLDNSFAMFNSEENLNDPFFIESSLNNFSDFENSLQTNPVLEYANFESNNDSAFELFQELTNPTTANSELEQESKSLNNNNNNDSNTIIKNKNKNENENENENGCTKTQKQQKQEKQRKKEKQQKQTNNLKKDEETTKKDAAVGKQKTTKKTNKFTIQKKIKKPINHRKRRYRQRSSNKLIVPKDNAYLVETGREVFKLLIGQLWVIVGGAPQKAISPYSKKFAEQIGQVFEANTSEIAKFQDQLKYLLSNSRRTFTEFVLEILIGVLSLSYLPKAPEVSQRFNSVLKQLSKLNQDTQLNDNRCDEHEQKANELKLELEKIYEKIFTFQTLMYWFDKRFIDKLSFFFNQEDQQHFYKSHLLKLGKSKFMLSCFLLTNDLADPNGPAKQYSECINLDFDNNPLNLYCNNRGNKLRIVKKMIVSQRLNCGDHWNSISNDYLSRTNFTEQNICKQLPFLKIFQNPNLSQCCKPNLSINPKKKRTLANKGKKTKLDLNLDLF
ncbi:neurogenic protein mastermind [Anaeramoeba flamelloides]|uniref:Neurogenic protein mastermind n=1 Tax=Anaeramoeba flamelloides TaxID=1746091 RepID=A0ABQ8YBK7_9EUKA|nr:neurogenic protein mastermind [Anaeramoeba flamelloides]